MGQKIPFNTTENQLPKRESQELTIPGSETNSIDDVTLEVEKDISRGVILDAEKEVRIKLYMGLVRNVDFSAPFVASNLPAQVFMGWLWIIPAFHMPQPDSSAPLEPGEATKLTLTRKEIDFPIGIGSELIDVEISMEWV